MDALESDRRSGGDPLGRILEAGLIATVIVAPWPFGAVIPEGRLGLELGAILLGVLWLLRAAFRPTPLPPLAVRVGLTGLVLLGAEILFGKILSIGIPGLMVAWLVTPTVIVFMWLYGTRILKMVSKIFSNEEVIKVRIAK